MRSGTMRFDTGVRLKVVSNIQNNRLFKSTGNISSNTLGANMRVQWDGMRVRNEDEDEE